MNMSTVDGFPLSSQQKRVWNLQQRVGTLFYHIASFHLSGDIDVNRLKSSIQLTVNRHEIFRTKFEKMEGMHYPVQVIDDEVQVSYFVYSPEEFFKEQEATDVFTTFTDEKIYQLFQSERGHSLHVELIKQSDQRYTLILFSSALNSDVTTLQRIMQEILQQYSSDETVSEEEIVQYVDYADWQEELLESRPDHVDGVNTMIFEKVLPYEVNEKQWPHGKDRVSLLIPSQLCLRIHALAQKWNIPVCILVLTSWITYLTKLVNGQINIGISIDGRRNYQELENGMGPYEKLANLVSPEQEDKTTYQTYASAVHDSYLGLAENVEYIDPRLSTNEQCTLPYQVQYVKTMKMDSGEISCYTEDIFSCLDSYKLKLMILERELESDSLFQLHIYYDQEIFQTQDIQTIKKQFMYVLEECAEHPENPLSDLRYIPRDEEKEWIARFNLTNNPLSKNDNIKHVKNILQMIDEQTKRHAQKVAIDDGMRSFTYKEVDKQSNQLASFLKSMDIQAEDRIALYLPRSVEAIISILAILKAGASFVPIDPKWPDERVKYVLQDSRAKAMIVQDFDEIKQRLLFNGPMIDLIHDKERIERVVSKHHLHLDNIEPNQLAYVMYTSGSTGMPKGVGIEHKSLQNYVWWFKHQFYDDVRLPFVSELGFDAFLKQVFCPLISGDKVTILSEEEVLDIDRLVSRFISADMTAFNCVPSLWNTILDEIEQKEHVINQLKNQLKVLFLGGDHISKVLLRRTKVLFPNLEIINLYGPTEATSNATFASITHSKSIFIGRPIANTEIYVLNEQLKHCGIDEIGELYIGGAGVARGYMNGAKLTAAHFIPHLHKEGQRLYKTGDLVRIRPNHQLEFIGRRDSQLKINGKRVDVREIEYIYEQHPLLENVVVLPEAEYQTIAAFCVPKTSTLTKDEMRFYGQEKLPQYMIPHTFVFVDEIPLNKNGKTDHQALINRLNQQVRREYVAPRNSTEQAVAEIWKEVLKVEQIGIKDNFFELGGHSLNATQLVSRLRRIYRIEIPISLIFETETIERLCEELENSVSQKMVIEEISAAYLKAKTLAMNK